ncbi:MAG: hypothetical protein U9N01_04420 [Euryarchaeota archaeon]|nr:hypothetical protein [Euryarchaeota archaeon]
MKKEDEIVDEIVEDIVDVILDHQYDLSDGFEYYDGAEAWKAIRSEIKEIIDKMEKGKGKEK